MTITSSAESAVCTYNRAFPLWLQCEDFCSKWRFCLILLCDEEALAEGRRGLAALVPPSPRELTSPFAFSKTLGLGRFHETGGVVALGGYCLDKAPIKSLIHRWPTREYPQVLPPRVTYDRVLVIVA